MDNNIKHVAFIYFMKFAHFADCHVGGWREEELKELGLKSLEKSIEICINENVAFVLICGDLFNTSLPQIEYIKKAAEVFRLLKDKDIDIYVIPGSHDYSPSGKTMLDVLEKAGLVTNVMKLNGNRLEFTEDKTGVKITGMYGRRVGLDKLDYASLDKSNLEKEKGFKIFMFHTILEEFKPNEFMNVKGESYTNMPKNFDYYAGGHVHYLFDIKKEGYGVIVYPGPLFPNNFKELEELKHGCICIVDDKLDIRRIPIKLKDVESIFIDVTDMSSEVAQNYIEKELRKRNLKDKIVTLRIEGELISGKISDIDINNIGKDLGAYIILKNISKLKSREFKEIEVKGNTAEEIENSVLKESKSEFEIENEEELSKRLSMILAVEKGEGETNNDFENRIISNLLEVFKDRLSVLNSIHK